MSDSPWMTPAESAVGVPTFPCPFLHESLCYPNTFTVAGVDEFNVMVYLRKVPATTLALPRSGPQGDQVACGRLYSVIGA